MITVDLSQIEGRRYPARRRTQNIVGGASPIQAENFSHRQRDARSRTAARCRGTIKSRKKSISSLEGTGEMCLGEERQVLTAGQAAYIPPGVFHQLTNIGDTPLADALLLRAGGRRGPLAAGTQRHAAPGRRRGPAAAGRRVSAMHGETETETVTSPARSDPMAQSTDSHSRHHHERRHRPHGHEPASHALDRGHPRSKAACKLGDGESIMPEPILVGRNAAKLEALAAAGRRVALDHRSGRGAGRSAQHASTSTPRRPTAAWRP